MMCDVKRHTTEMGWHWECHQQTGKGKGVCLLGGGCWGHLWVGRAGSCWDGASPHLPQSSQHSGPHVGSVLLPGHQADSVPAQVQVAWNGTPTPSHTTYAPTQPVIINSPPERPSPSGIKQGGVLVWLSHGKNQGNNIC